MSSLSLENVDILVIDPDRSVRTTFRNILTDNGCRYITVGSSMEDIEIKFRLGMPDLLIADINMADDANLYAFVHGLRHHIVGSNPFMSIIATAWSPTTEEVRNIIQAGADDLIIKPMSANLVIQRIKNQINARKPFVVTSAYIGPDRRKPGPDHDRGQHIDPIEVPNTLRAKALSENSVDIQMVQSQIDSCIQKVNLEKLDRHAYQVTWLVDRLIPSLKSNESKPSTKHQLNRLLYVVEDISRRMVGTEFEHVGTLCRSLRDVTQRIIGTQGQVSDKDIELMAPLAQSIQRGFDKSDEEAQRAAKEISNTVAGQN
ncbi:response regulator [Magnetovibrio sp. PR-2]|uniref:response regulator n=1 Tax=Magnetovibrio sp. PR-2 TaxID=3120356 RepID=UPI002FCE52F2